MLIQELIGPSTLDAFSTGHSIQRFSPLEIRLCIQTLVAEQQIEMACALGDAGLALYPHDADMLAINGLLVMLSEQWGRGIDLLSELLEQQGDATPAFVYAMLVRALRCNLDPAAALQMAHRGLAHYPQQAELLAERETLEAYLHAATPAGLTH